MWKIIFDQRYQPGLMIEYLVAVSFELWML